jgi:hypothetical protein
MTTSQIDYSQPILLPMQNGGVHKLQLDLQIPGHAMIASAISAIAQASVPVYADLNKSAALTERQIIANTALRSGLIAGL